VKIQKAPERRRRTLSVQWLIIVLAAIPPTLASVSSLIVTLRSGSAVIEVKAKVEEVARHTNSMKDALIDAAKTEGRAAGVQEEKIRQRSNGQNPN
jgi:hypothetical protein